VFSPDGRLVLTRSWNTRSWKRISFWDARRRRELLEMNHIEELSNMAFSPDGRLAIFCDTHGRVYFHRGQEPELGKLLGLYVAPYEVGAIYWPQPNQVIVADKGGSTWRPHFYHLMLEGKWE
jgi:WD40 repeat protein